MMDHVVRLETAIVIFFDLKVYEITWKYGIIMVRHNLELKGRLTNLIV